MKSSYKSYVVHCVETGFTSALRDKLTSVNVSARNLEEAMSKGLNRADKSWASGRKHEVESVALVGTYYIFLKCPCCKLWMKTIATQIQ